MRTKKQANSALTEQGISSRLSHNSFLEFSVNTKRFKKRKFTRTAEQEDENTLAMLGIENYILEPAVSLSPEFIAYTFHLSGVSRKLLMYILFFEVHTEACTFELTGMKERFSKFCLMFEDKTYAAGVIQQALKNLERANTLVFFQPELCMLNPMLLAGMNSYKRKKLLNQYTAHLLQNGKDASADFYPLYRL